MILEDPPKQFDIVVLACFNKRADTLMCTGAMHCLTNDFVRIIDTGVPLTRCCCCDAATAMDLLKQSVALDSLSEEFDAYYLPGGHGTAVDFRDNEKLQSLLSAAWKNGKVVSSVCHGPIGELLGVPTSVSGRALC